MFYSVSIHYIQQQSQARYKQIPSVPTVGSIRTMTINNTFLVPMIIVLLISFFIVVLLFRSETMMVSNRTSAEPFTLYDRSLRSITALPSKEFVKLMTADQPTGRTLEDFCQCKNGDNFYSGSCDGLHVRHDSHWCSTGEGAYCCATSEHDCCNISSTRVVLVVLALLVAVAFIILALCRYWKPCPGYQKQLPCKARRPRESSAEPAPPQPAS